ncbi:MAG: D-alanyl-D-alanine carboxypeptidase (penicillin-binding protein 5/6) [Halanaerobium sp. 4-GBenrich]|jgi:D-alanyl-D-alanine carboxypeptidase (penicillin-binding protein 5/6)|uniref:serine-type D-Ala-D-Ala carboxypeptidase n=1 Tax=Halanaerobium congolense TaxID=54121 RepID=A0A1G6LP36_9FIRM|nr:D-alanyl-D-alanine carboxypeptidase family protein [Halanaerobium congolense]ODS49871.1 MAG: D-alanyl-D-alanine carboxypeptidase (penicillin-binding protein 5/6) [Halanaerobium sp. 4-GBenrich]OEG63568.1 MAG: D-alanyl-D-alanine carboxypeptidase [Halanaerobium sp. MDAL1]PTX15634.1 D-alanyl-D-alanine carboxypeptidase (penicillin-binding protein 5/6) [Halanaerobium congolense]PXV68738.1 D-alanyl-D-alanine carboxypeptidase (penicillin-binding protein 5/6) [Halanaerobium congolense]TDP09424.1 D-a
MKKSIIAISIISILFSLVFATPVLAFDVATDSAILLEVETGQVLFEKNADRKLPPASITKIMSLLITMEKLEEGSISLDDKVTISRYAQSMGGSQIYLKANTQVELEKLLKAVTIASGNDASVAIAEYIAGTYSNFIAMMNDKAQELGMNSTNFVNSTGLPDPNHYSTARDISIMAKELSKYPQVLEWASIWTETIQLPNRKAMLVNTNSLINKYPSMDGLKTGHTQEAGFCLASTAKKGDTRLISIVLQGETLTEREESTTRLLDYGFNAFSKRKIAAAGDQIQNIPIAESANKVAVGEVASDLYVMVQKGQEKDISQEVKVKDSLTAPIEKGEVLGELTVYNGEKIISTVDVVAAAEIERANIITRMWRKIFN